MIRPAGPPTPTRYDPHPGRVNAASEAEPGTHEPPDAVTPRRIALLIPPELLQSGETIILLLKPSPWYILLESLRFIAGVVVVMIAVGWLYNQGYYVFLDRHDLLLIGAIAIGARLFWQFLEWLSRVYALTDRRVVRVKGVIHVQVFETQLAQIQHTTTTFSLIERPFGPRLHTLRHRRNRRRRSLMAHARQPPRRPPNRRKNPQPIPLTHTQPQHLITSPDREGGVQPIRDINKPNNNHTTSMTRRLPRRIPRSTKAQPPRTTTNPPPPPTTTPHPPDPITAPATCPPNPAANTA